MNILIIDDDIHLMTFLSKSLESEGYFVNSASNPDAVMRELHLRVYEVIIIELNFGHCNTLQLLRKVRSQSPDSAIIVLTARNKVSDRIEALNLGADDYVPKPFSFQELTARINAVRRRKIAAPQQLEAIQFYSCFISYSFKDQNFADRLHADLQANGVRCWFAPHDMKGGKKLHEQIDQAIRVHERLLLILSPSSMNSEWVKTEIAKARKREIEEKQQILFPIRLADFDVIKKWECFDTDTGKDSAKEIREYFIPDFSNWTAPLSYKTAFEHLLKDLRGDGSKGVAAP